MKARLLLCATVIALVGINGGRSLGEHIEQSSGQPSHQVLRVLQIEFEGNKVLSDDELLGAMKSTKPGALYLPEALKNDLERVRFFALSAQGFLNASIGEPRLELITFPLEGVRIVIPIDEGRQYRFGRVTIEGNRAFSAEQIKAIVGICSGDVVRSTVIQKGLYETLKDLYGRLGYIQMIVSAASHLKDDPANPSQGVADFTVSIEEGPQYRVGLVTISGAPNIPPGVLRRALLVSEGQIFNQALWESSLQNLNQLGAFEEIKPSDVTMKPDSQRGTVDIELRVKEKKRH